LSRLSFFVVVYFLDFPFFLVVYFLPRLFDFFSCPEFPFFWCLYFLDFPFFGCLFLAQTFLFFFLPRVSLFLVICFLEFLLFVVVYFLSRLSDFDFYVHKEADERPSPFFCCFFLDLSFQSKLMSGRLFAAPKQHQAQSVGSGQAVPTPH